MSDSTSNNSAVLFERIGQHIALITLNRPEKRNAVNGDVTKGLTAAIATVESDPDLRVAILAANGPIFCAGADLGEIAAGRGAALMTAAGGFAGFVKAPRSKPWIAAIAGTAVGGGCELALACDMVVAGTEAQLGLPEAKRGLVAAGGGAIRIARAVPRAIAIEMLVTGRPLNAQQALAYGLANRVVPTDEVVKSAIALAEEIAGNAPIAVKEMLNLAKLTADLDETALWQLSDGAAERIMRSEDAKEGPRAFVEKRAPRWTGR